MKGLRRITGTVVAATMVLGLVGCNRAREDVATQCETESQTQIVEETQEEELFVNLIQNGDFSNGTNYFNSYTNGGSVSLKTNSEGMLVAQISHTGNVDYGVQVYYDGFELKQGAEYEMSFDVKADVARTIQWRVQINGGDYHAYHQELVSVTEDISHVAVRFTMEEASDPAPRLCFNMGAVPEVAEDQAHNVMLDNICLMMVSADGIVAQQEEEAVPQVKINQIGYLPKDSKIAVFADLSEQDDTFFVINEQGESVYEGSIAESVWDNTTGEMNARGDFSAVTKPGTYKIRTAEGLESYSFVIGEQVYQNLMGQVVDMYTMQRCGEALTEDAAGVFAHPACHTSTATIYGTDKKIDVSGGWHDAGDYGRYVVPAAKAVADLLLAYEQNPDAFSEVDVLELVKYELDWMLKMQDPATGGVYHKVTCRTFPGTCSPEQETEELIVAPLSKAASADFAASMALASRIYAKNGQEAYAKTCLDAAAKAYDYYLLHIDERGFTNPSDISTGEYADGSTREEYFWAAAELYKTTGEQKYLEGLDDAFDRTLKHNKSLGGLGWMDMNGYGAYAALTTPALMASSSNLYGEIKKEFLTSADAVVARSEKNSYLACRENDYEWGSNMGIANEGMLLLLANEIAPKQVYVDTAKAQLHYLLGVNATGYCFVTGCGTHYPKNPHHRPSQVAGFAVPGMLVGGPDNALEDPYAKAVLQGVPAAKCYADNEQSYSCNEVTIYWNSPLVYLLASM